MDWSWQIFIGVFLGVVTWDLIKYAWRNVKWQDNKQSTVSAYCPRCKRDLCNTENVLTADEDFVYYTCICKLRSVWDFDTYPAPVLVRTEH